MTLPEDLEGNNPLNLKTEFKRLSDLPNKYNCIIPTYGPFFRTDFVVTDDDSNVLYEGMDYYLGHYYKELSESIRRPVFGSIVLINGELNGINFERYRSVGGPHLIPPSDVVRYLTNPEMTDPRSTDWSDVMTRVVDIKVLEPPKTIDESIERDSLSRSLNDLVVKMKQLKDNKKGNLEEFSEDSKSLVDNYRIKLDHDKHIQDTGNYAHELNPANVNAAARVDVAPNAKTLYGQGKEVSISSMRRFFLNAGTLEELVSKTAAKIIGVLELLPDTAINKSNGISISNTEDRVLISNGKNRLVIDVNVGKNGKANFKLVSGFNMFNLNNLEPVCFINGSPVLTTEYAHLYLNPSLGEAERVSVRNTPSVSLFGQGTEQDPIRGEVTVRPATTQEVGRFRVADDFSVGSVATSDYMYKLMRELDNYLPNTATINGKLLKDSPVLTRGDVDLGSVNNTSPEAKALNTAFVTEASKKSTSTHNHAIADITNIRIADNNTVGFIRYGNIAQPRDDRAVYRRDLVGYKSTVDNLNVDVGGTISQRSLSGYIVIGLTVTEETNEDGDVTTIFSDFLLRTTSGFFEISGKGFTNLFGPVSVVSGELVISPTGDIVATKYGDVLNVFSAYHYGRTRTWIEHWLDPEAHPEIARQGIYSLIKNYPLIRDWVNPDINILVSWLRWSHLKTTSSTPALSDELLSWGWEDNALVVLEDTLSFISVVKDNPDSEYKIDELITSKNTIDGNIIIVIGAWYEDEVERTLSLVFTNNPNGESSFGVAIYLDYNRENEVILSVLNEDSVLKDLVGKLIRVRGEVHENGVYIEYAQSTYDDSLSGNLVYEIDYLPLEYNGRYLSWTELTEYGLSKRPMRKGYGVVGKSKGVSFKGLVRDSSELTYFYSAQSYLKQATTNQTSIVSLSNGYYKEIEVAGEGNSYTFQVEVTSGTCDVVVIGNYPHNITIGDNIDGEINVVIELLNVNPSNGDQLYECPEKLSVKCRLLDVVYS